MKSPNFKDHPVRALIEPGYFPLFQSTGVCTGWTTGLKLPALWTLNKPHRSKFKDPFDHCFEAEELRVYLQTSGQWPADTHWRDLQRLSAQDQSLTDAVLQSIHDFYPRVQTLFADLPPARRRKVLPEINSPAELRSLLRLDGLVLHESKNSAVQPYVGFEFDCSWDVHNGLGVLMYGTELLDIGSNDAALNTEAVQAHQQARRSKTGSKG